MRRAVVITCALLVCTLGGCATLRNDRYYATGGDPFLWWLSGAPQPYDLNWPRTYPPDLPVLNPSAYTAMPPPRPLDVPRGWNPDYPPYMGTGNDRPAAEPAAPPAAEQGCAARCDTPTTDADAAAGRAGVRADAGDGERASPR